MPKGATRQNWQFRAARSPRSPDPKSAPDSATRRQRCWPGIPGRQGRTIPPRITATHLGAPAEPPKPVLGLASKYSPGRATPAKCRSITNPPCGRDRIAAISWQQKVGPQPGRAANSQRGPELPRLKDLIVCQRGIGPAAEVAAGLIQAAAPGSPGHPPRAPRAANTPGHGR